MVYELDIKARRIDVRKSMSDRVNGKILKWYRNMERMGEGG